MASLEYNIDLKTSIGNLCVCACHDDEYPAVAISLIRNDGIEIGLAFIEIDEGNRTANAYLYEDTANDEWTKKCQWTEDVLNISL